MTEVNSIVLAMNKHLSSIQFKSSLALAAFLSDFLGTGSTALFHVTDLGNDTFLLEFTGAY
jgi:hypothetical protein